MVKIKFTDLLDCTGEQQLHDDDESLDMVLSKSEIDVKEDIEFIGEKKVILRMS